ncbi:MAG: D-sedoheptulose 7-phosphate isomerase [Candidatus Cloacimonetes bacterium]|nr:D-sedoheptulose 7-phosphate isomerase [Candidatus Cloacimonadota bacterium]
MEFIKNNFQESNRLKKDFMNDEKNLQKLEEVIFLLVDKHTNGNKGITCGNGGSACDAMHYAEELTGRFRKDREALGAIALTDPSYITCVANDFGFDKIFSRGIEALGKKDDYLIAISTSGNSPNIIKAVEAAKQKDMLIIGLLGKDGGALKDLVDYAFIVPASTSDRIQEIHILLIHTIIEGIERIMFKENYC